MTNKEKIKKVIEKDFDKKSNYDMIIKKTENIGFNVKKIKYAIIPISIIILIVITLIFNNNPKTLPKILEENIKYNNKIIINDYDFITPEVTASIAGEAYEKSIEELISEYSFINNFFIFGSDTKIKRCFEYKYENDQYSIGGYYIIYTDSSETKFIDIFFSKSLNTRPRCVENILLDELDNSIIHNTNVKIAKYNNYFLTLFEKNGIYFDIEVTGITQDELIKLIDNILDSDI